MLPAMIQNLTCMNDSAPFSFPLLWTVGFTGKRNLPVGDAGEAKVARALDVALEFLVTRAKRQGARLTAVSSIARGADVLFAQACEKERDGKGSEISWKCILPFPLEPFLHHDLKDVEDTNKRERLRGMAEACLAKARPLTPLVADAPPGFDPNDSAMRDTAYQEGGYQVVDASDVLIAVLRGDELAQLKEAVKRREALEKKRQEAWAKDEDLKSASLDEVLKETVTCMKAGTLAVTLYAYAAKHPCILVNADENEPEKKLEFLNDPEKREVPESWFHAKNLKEVLQEALKAPAPEDLESKCEEAAMQTSAGPDTEDRRRVWKLMRYLSQYANHAQKKTHNGLLGMLALHLIATGVAATLATGLGLTSVGFYAWKEQAFWLVVGIALLATCKPLLALWAYLIEHNLHHKHQRENWLQARVLSELCRGMWAMWQLPKQPLDAADEEDFPKLKRLLRTLRLMRELDTGAGTRADEQRCDESQEEADLRVGTENYIRLRLHDQARYYHKNVKKAQASKKRNERLFIGSLWGTILVGSGIALLKWKKLFVAGAVEAQASVLETPWLDLLQWAELLVIMGPFLATYALARITILDCRRRARRYQEMQAFLLRLADTLRDCTANSSRLRIIEHAERMMIEEQHEWFSTTRNFSV